MMYLLVLFGWVKMAYSDLLRLIMHLLGLFDKRKLAYIGLSVLILSAFFSMLNSCVFYVPEGDVESASKFEYASISTEYLGNYLSKTYPNSKTLIIYNAIPSTKVVEQRIIGLRKANNKVNEMKYLKNSSSWRCPKCKAINELVYIVCKECNEPQPGKKQ